MNEKAYNIYIFSWRCRTDRHLVRGGYTFVQLDVVVFGSSSRSFILTTQAVALIGEWASSMGNIMEDCLCPTKGVERENSWWVALIHPLASRQVEHVAAVLHGLSYNKEARGSKLLATSRSPAAAIFFSTHWDAYTGEPRRDPSMKVQDDPLPLLFTRSRCKPLHTS